MINQPFGRRWAICMGTPIGSRPGLGGGGGSVYTNFNACLLLLSLVVDHLAKGVARSRCERRDSVLGFAARLQPPSHCMRHGLLVFWMSGAARWPAGHVLASSYKHRRQEASRDVAWHVLTQHCSCIRPLLWSLGLSWSAPRRLDRYASMDAARC